jgi:hypothetical protein
MKLGPAMKLRRYHEFTVAAADEQFLEYRIAIRRREC